jgi:NDP-sugar pyrophosphorylase family protein
VTLPVAILAGGLATRLGPIVADTPKSLVNVGGRPFIFHQLELLRKNGITQVVVCTGHLGTKIQQVVGDGSAHGLRVDYSFDGPILLGTGGAIKKAVPLLGQEFFVLYGDSYLDIDYRAVSDAFHRSGKLGLMTVFKNEGRWDRSNVQVERGNVLAYDKKNPTPDMAYIDYGLGALKSAAFDQVPAGQPYDLADVYAGLVKRGELAGFEVTQRFYEVGSLAGLEETNAYLTNKSN